MQVVRIYTGPDGKSHLEDVDIELEDRGAAGRISPLWSGSGVQFREVDGDYHIDYHNAPRRQLVVNLTGSVEIETGSGDRRVLCPGPLPLPQGPTRPGHTHPRLRGAPPPRPFLPPARPAPPPPPHPPP